MPDLLSRLQTALADRYTVERAIGAGGMATVYLANDLKHERQVAVKLLKPELGAVLGVERFLREIRIAASLTHPHIVGLHDSGEFDGLLYYVMPYIPGESLRKRLERETQLSIDHAIEITRQVAAALDYAHRQGVVHRDIKPENILLQEDLAVVADFGIARAIRVAGGERLTETGLSLGTPHYMSPEQASGTEELDGRSDLYSLGCVLYEMLAGDPPFTGPTSPAVIARQLVDPVPSLRTVRPAVPEELERAIEKVLAKVPADRFTSGTEFLESLQGAVAVGTPRRERRRRRWLPLGLVAAAVAVIGLWSLLGRPAPSLDYSRIVVFPLAERGLVESGVGYDIALMISAALDRVEELKLIDVWRHLSDSQRSDVTSVSPDAARSMALDRGAGFYIDGVVRVDEDSAVVVLRLYDAGGDSLVTQKSATDAAGLAPLHQLGVTAMRNVIPFIVGPDRVVDFAAFGTSTPAAVALWFTGERRYRNAQLQPAVESLRRALEEDSSLAVAGLMGAWASSLRSGFTEASELLDAALLRDSLLTTEQRYLAFGLSAFLDGYGDSAVTQFERALVARPDWPEALMALGETYSHMLPARPQLDSLARASFVAAYAADSTFAPPLFHLAQSAALDGQVDVARQYLAEFRSYDPDSLLLTQADVLVSCIRNGPEGIDWSALAESSPIALVGAARFLSAGALHPSCGEPALRALLDAGTLPSSVEGDAFFTLMGLMVAQTRTDEAIALLERSESYRGTELALSYYLLNTIAGSDMEAKATEIINSVRAGFGPRFERARTPQLLWLLGAWYAHEKDREQLRYAAEALESVASEQDDRRSRMFADALAAHLVLAQGDTTAAITRFRALRPTADPAQLGWGMAEGLPYERVTLAQLLLARGQYREAIDVASILDHPTCITYIVFVRPSLLVRVRAAEALGDAAAANQYRERLQQLSDN